MLLRGSQRPRGGRGRPAAARRREPARVRGRRGVGAGFGERRCRHGPYAPRATLAPARVRGARLQACEAGGPQSPRDPRRFRRRYVDPPPRATRGDELAGCAQEQRFSPRGPANRRACARATAKSSATSCSSGCAARPASSWLPTSSSTRPIVTSSCRLSIAGSCARRSTLCARKGVRSRTCLIASP